MRSSVAEVASPQLKVKIVVIDDAFLQQECYNASGGVVKASQVEENPKDQEVIPPNELKQRCVIIWTKSRRPRTDLASTRSSKTLQAQG